MTKAREIFLCAVCLVFGTLCAGIFFILLGAWCVGNLCRHAFLGFRGRHPILL
jgi:hypothetical protein